MRNMMSYIMKYGYIHFGFKFMNGIRQSTCIRFPVWKPWGFPYVGFLEDPKMRKCGFNRQTSNLAGLENPREIWQE